MQNLLNRSDAPFDTKIWNLLDETVRGVAKSQLSARKLLFTEGPYGLKLQSIPGKEQYAENESLQLSSNKGQNLILINDTFSLSARDISAFLESDVRMDIEPLVESILKVSAKEDEIIYYGLTSLGSAGIFNAQGTHKTKLKSWDQVGDAVENIISAVDKLDSVGFHGPYTLGLSPQLYNKLFRRYPQADILEIDHLKNLVTDGIVKAAAIKNGGVLLASGKEFSSIVLGQDLNVGFEGPSGRDFVFTLSESITLRITVPQSICLLEM